jgi:hypothetical protein
MTFDHGINLLGLSAGKRSLKPVDPLNMLGKELRSFLAAPVTVLIVLLKAHHG